MSRNFSKVEIFSGFNLITFTFSENSNYGRESLLEVYWKNIAGRCQQTFCFQKFVDITQHQRTYIQWLFLSLWYKECTNLKVLLLKGFSISFLRLRTILLLPIHKLDSHIPKLKIHTHGKMISIHNTFSSL